MGATYLHWIKDDPFNKEGKRNENEEDGGKALRIRL